MAARAKTIRFRGDRLGARDFTPRRRYSWRSHHGTQIRGAIPQGSPQQMTARELAAHSPQSTAVMQRSRIMPPVSGYRRNCASAQQVCFACMAMPEQTALDWLEKLWVAWLKTEQDIAHARLPVRYAGDSLAYTISVWIRHAAVSIARFGRIWKVESFRPTPGSLGLRLMIAQQNRIFRLRDLPGLRCALAIQPASHFDSRSKISRITNKSLGTSAQRTAKPGQQRQRRRFFLSARSRWSRFDRRQYRHRQLDHSDHFARYLRPQRLSADQLYSSLPPNLGQLDVVEDIAASAGCRCRPHPSHTPASPSIGHGAG